MTDYIFSPAFGNKPGELVGREADMKNLIDGLSSRRGSKERAHMIIGQRGLGKTVLLLELAEYAQNNGYIVASPTVVAKGMLERILEKLERSGRELLKKNKTKVTGGSVSVLGFGAGIQTKSDEEPKRSFAYRLLDFCEEAERFDKGVLILIDEVQANNEELKQLIIAYQEMVGEGKNIAIVFAGLPVSVSTVLNEHVLTFFNRASKLTLGPIKTGDITVYLRSSFKKLRINLSNELIEQAAKATEGSPYLMQLIGHYIVISANDVGQITAEQYNEAIELSTKEFITDICTTTLATLSEKDIEFLKAMSLDDKESAISDIGERLNVNSAYVQRYKKRLLQSGVIDNVRRGYVDFAVPYLREYLLSDSRIQ